MAKGDSFSVIPTYIKHWTESKPWGTEIRILSESGLQTIQCKWYDRKRDENGRVSNNPLKKKEK